MSVQAPVQADFTYNTPLDDGTAGAGHFSIFADCTHLRDAIRDDAIAAGLNVRDIGALDALFDGPARILGDVTMIDCPQPHARVLAGLTRLDMRAARSGSRLIVSTTLEHLDDVFGCLSMSKPLILVSPSRPDRLIAIGRSLLGRSAAKLRDLSEEDRLMLLRLTEQVGQIAERMDRLASNASAPEASAFRFAAPAPGYAGRDDESDRLVRASRPPLPDPRLVRRIIRQRQLRARFLDGDLFADPAWDMLLDLTAARAEHTRVSVTSLCIASGVPPTTALRWIGQLTEAGLFERVEDESDRRRAFIALTERAADAMARFFAELGRNAARMV